MSFSLNAVRSLKACWRLAGNDDDGLKDLDLTQAGFWQSFAAIYLVAPLYLYSSAASARLAIPAQPEVSWFATLSVLALLWVLWPWIMVTLAHMIGRERNYARYIIAYNWSSVYIIAVFMPILALQELGVMGNGIGAIFGLLVVLWTLYYRWYLARLALDTTSLIAVGLVAGDLAISIAASSLI